jgi:hypothetical protein
MDEPAASIEDVGGQEEMTAAHLMGSFSMEDSRALQINDVAAAGRREDEQLTQVSYLFTSLCLLFLFLFSNACSSMFHRTPWLWWVQRPSTPMYRCLDLW